MAFVDPAKVPPIQVLSDQLRLLQASTSSPYQMSVMVVDVPPGGFVPPHRHAREEEGYFVLAGQLALSIGDDTRLLNAGEFGHVPPMTSHAYANQSSAPTRFLAWTDGGPIDAFFQAMSEQVHTMPDDAPTMMALTQRFGIEMLGPPPA